MLSVVGCLVIIVLWLLFRICRSRFDARPSSLVGLVSCWFVVGGCWSLVVGAWLLVGHCC